MIKESISYLKLLPIIVLAAVLMIAPVADAKSEDITADSKIVTIYDGDNEQTVITKGRTVKDALKDAQVKLNPHDTSSPRVDAKLDSSMTVVRINRARPVTVVDGVASSRVVTPDSDDAQVADRADASLKSNDTTSTHLVTDFISQGGPGEQIKIKRAIPVTFNIYGQTITLRTQKSTVKEMLEEAGIHLQANDTASISLETPITENMPSFNIWRNGVQTIEATEDVPFETEVHEDSTKQQGYNEIQVAGQVGKKTVIYQVNMQNGVEVSRNKISEVVTVQPVKQIEIKGTKVALPPGSHQDWMAMAGIPESDWGAANYIINRESGWNPRANNKSSGAYGLPQALPGSKMASAGSDWRDNPITQLKWFYKYCKGRYGSVQGAYNFWQSHHWY